MKADLDLQASILGQLGVAGASDEVHLVVPSAFGASCAKVRCRPPLAAFMHRGDEQPVRRTEMLSVRLQGGAISRRAAGSVERVELAVDGIG